VDPLTFGSYTLLFSLFILLGASEYWHKLGFTNRWLCGLSVFSGIYLSITSGSRTGWLNLPVFFCIWALLVLKPKFGVKRTILILIFFMIILFGALFENRYLFNKFILALTDILHYKWDAPNPDTSVGLRLSFYRMGLTYILERPIVGWGDLGWMLEMNRPDFMQFANDFVRESPKHGFHNEIITNAIRSGVWGLFASLSFFALIFTRAIQGIRNKTKCDHRLISITLLVFISHLFIAGLTTEITNLVFLSSFIGLTLSVLLGEQINLEEKLKKVS
jgi:O-antigen ligase